MELTLSRASLLEANNCQSLGRPWCCCIIQAGAGRDTSTFSANNSPAAGRSGMTAPDIPPFPKAQGAERAQAGHGQGMGTGRAWAQAGHRQDTGRTQAGSSAAHGLSPCTPGQAVWVQTCTCLCGRTPEASSQELDGQECPGCSGWQAFLLLSTTQHSLQLRRGEQGITDCLC